MDCRGRIKNNLLIFLRERKKIIKRHVRPLLVGLILLQGKKRHALVTGRVQKNLVNTLFSSGSSHYLKILKFADLVSMEAGSLDFFACTVLVILPFLLMNLLTCGFFLLILR